MNAETVQWFLMYSKVTASELSECSNWCCGLKSHVCFVVVAWSMGH